MEKDWKAVLYGYHARNFITDKLIEDKSGNDNTANMLHSI